jgi:hypothetical protein
MGKNTPCASRAVPHPPGPSAAPQPAPTTPAPKGKTPHRERTHQTLAKVTNTTTWTASDYVSYTTTRSRNCWTMPWTVAAHGWCGSMNAAVIP